MAQYCSSSKKPRPLRAVSPRKAAVGCSSTGHLEQQGHSYSKSYWGSTMSRPFWGLLQFVSKEQRFLVPTYVHRSDSSSACVTTARLPRTAFLNHHTTTCLCTVAPRCQRKLDWDSVRYKLWSRESDCAAPRDSRVRAAAVPDLHSPPKPCYKDHAVREAPGVRYSRTPGTPRVTCFLLCR